MASKKINILFTIPNFKTAGSQFVLLAIYKRLDRNRFQPFVLVEKFPEIFPETIPENERLYLTADLGNRTYIKQFATLLKNQKIEVVHSWDYKSNSLEALACRKVGVPYVYTKKNNAWSKRWFAKSFLASHIAYNNPEMLTRFFTSPLLKRKISFIPHGVDTSVFKPLPDTREDGFFTVGCIGVLGANKNQLFLLKGLEQLPQHFRVFFYGKGDEDYKKQLLEYMEKHSLSNRVEFKGYIENTDIPHAMSSCNAIVLPSLNEGLPLSIMEAMACGVPVLSSNSGGGARFLLKDFLKETIFSLETSHELVDQLKRIADTSNGLAERLSAYGIKRVKNEFSIDQEVQAYSSLYSRMVK